MGRHEWDKGIVVPFAQAEGDQDKNRQQDENFQRGGQFANQLNAAHVHIRDQGNQCYRDQVVFPADNSGKPELQIIRKEDGIGTSQQERSGPVPPACQESPEITKSGAYPAIEAALHGHGGG